MASTVLVWFRQDLRLSDNPAFHQAAQIGKILPVYIFDDSEAGEFKIGAASRWWLQRSLESLNKSLHGNLQVFSGKPVEILSKLAREHQIDSVYFNRCYEPWRIHQENQVSKVLKAQSFNGSLLWEPKDILKADSTYYRVFTPYYKNGCLTAKPPRKPLPVPKFALVINSNPTPISLDLSKPWQVKLESHWSIGESAAQKCLDSFLKNTLNNYTVLRDFPAQEETSRLSPHLHFGNISPHQIWWAVYPLGLDFLRQLAWREFSYYLLYHFPQLHQNNFQKKYDNFPWEQNQHYLKAWQHGLTGIPLVDAGMRELWETGTMHNRVRMIAASFLTKNLLIDWREGASWFWDCLVDADLANNSASWQWVAGSGVDAAPYYRIFNPVLQAQKFDPQGIYIKRWLPERSQTPIIDLQASRVRALKAYQEMNRS